METRLYVHFAGIIEPIRLSIAFLSVSRWHSNRLYRLCNAQVLRQAGGMAWQRSKSHFRLLSEYNHIKPKSTHRPTHLQYCFISVMRLNTKMRDLVTDRCAITRPTFCHRMVHKLSSANGPPKHSYATAVNRCRSLILVSALPQYAPGLPIVALPLQLPVFVTPTHERPPPANTGPMSFIPATLQTPGLHTTD